MTQTDIKTRDQAYVDPVEEYEYFGSISVFMHTTNSNFT